MMSCRERERYFRHLCDLMIIRNRQNCDQALIRFECHGQFDFRVWSAELLVGTTGQEKERWRYDWVYWVVFRLKAEGTFRCLQNDIVLDFIGQIFSGFDKDPAFLSARHYGSAKLICAFGRDVGERWVSELSSNSAPILFRFVRWRKQNVKIVTFWSLSKMLSLHKP